MEQIFQQEDMQDKFQGFCCLPLCQGCFRQCCFELQLCRRFPGRKPLFTTLDQEVFRSFVAESPLSMQKIWNAMIFCRSECFSFAFVSVLLLVLIQICFW